MHAEISIEFSSLGDAFEPSPEYCQRIQGAMGEILFEIVRENFGETGIDRPSTWPELSSKYAKKVGRDYATLHLKGDLESAVKFDNSNPEYAQVSVSDSDVPYAAAHQWGTAHLPARPFFPIDEYGQLTEFAAQEVIAAAQEEAKK